MTYPPQPPTIKPQEAIRLAERAAWTLWLAMMDANANGDTAQARDLHQLFWREKKRTDYQARLSVSHSESGRPRT